MALTGQTVVHGCWRGAVVSLAVLLFPPPSQGAADSGLQPSSNLTFLGGRPEKILREIIGRSEEDTRIGSHFSLDAECRIDQIFDYLGVIPPQHGTICYRIETNPVRFNNVPGREKCIGNQVISKVLYYRPSDNYVGIDNFEYQAVFMNVISSIVDTKLTIIPTAHPQAEGPDSVAITKLQSRGLVSKCAAPVSYLNLERIVASNGAQSRLAPRAGEGGLGSMSPGPSALADPVPGSELGDVEYEIARDAWR